MREQLVSFEVAKLLKELGFKYECNHVYNINWKDKSPINLKWYENRNIDDPIYDYINAPTLSLVQKWLRDEMNIFINIHSYLKSSYNITGLFKKIGNLFNTYEEALEDAILTALNYLKNESSNI